MQAHQRIADADPVALGHLNVGNRSGEWRNDSRPVDVQLGPVPQRFCTLQLGAELRDTNLILFDRELS